MRQQSAAAERDAAGAAQPRGGAVVRDERGDDAARAEFEAASIQRQAAEDEREEWRERADKSEEAARRLGKVVSAGLKATAEAAAANKTVAEKLAERDARAAAEQQAERPSWLSEPAPKKAPAPKPAPAPAAPAYKAAAGSKKE